MCLLCVSIMIPGVAPGASNCRLHYKSKKYLYIEEKHLNGLAHIVLKHGESVKLEFQTSTSSRK